MKGSTLHVSQTTVISKGMYQGEIVALKCVRASPGDLLLQTVKSVRASRGSQTRVFLALY